MAKIDFPSGVNGNVAIDAYYLLDKDTHKFSSDTASAKIKWKSIKVVELQVIVTYILMKKGRSLAGAVPVIGEGGFGYSARWNVSYTEKGVELEQVGSRPTMFTKMKKEGDIDVSANPDAPNQSKDGASKPFVQMTIPFVVKYDIAGFSADVGGLGGGAEIGAEKEEAGSEVSFKLDLQIIDQPAEAKPMQKISRDLTFSAVYFEKRGEANVPSSSLRDLKKWTDEIKKNEALYLVIADGLVPIHLEGNTSKSGSKDFNAQLAKQRIEAVERVLKSQMSAGKLKLVSDPKAQSKFEEQNDYRVDIRFDKSKAESAMDARQK